MSRRPGSLIHSLSANSSIFNSLKEKMDRQWPFLCLRRRGTYCPLTSRGSSIATNSLSNSLRITPSKVSTQDDYCQGSLKSTDLPSYVSPFLPFCARLVSLTNLNTAGPRDFQSVLVRFCRHFLPGDSTSYREALESEFGCRSHPCRPVFLEPSSAFRVGRERLFGR